MVWKEGMDKWVPASTVKGLFNSDASATAKKQSAGKPRWVIYGTSVLGLIAALFVAAAKYYEVRRARAEADKAQAEAEQTRATSPSSKAKVEPQPKVEPTDRFTYLSNLRPDEVKVENNVFSQNGHFESFPLFVRGVRAEHMIVMCPPVNNYSRVTFALDRAYEQFISEAVIALRARGQEEPRSPLTFEVLGDGRSLWKSNALTKKGQGQECKIGIKGVRVLELRVYCPGSNHWAQAGWNEPKLVLGTP
jgi:hypothetical protein